MRHQKPPNLNERLVRRIRDLSMPLLPQPTGLKPVLHRLTGVRAVLFDVYGTLLVSASGDIGRDRHGRRNKALTESFRSAGFATTSRSSVRRGIELLDRAMMDAHKTLRKRGCLHPEIDICRIWSVVLRELAGRGIIVGPVNSETVQTLAVEYECRVNSVWPMPGLRRTLTSMRRVGLVLGIVSNAQFYTPLILQSFLGNRLVSALVRHKCLCVVVSYSRGKAVAAPAVGSVETSPSSVRNRTGRDPMRGQRHAERHLARG